MKRALMVAYYFPPVGGPGVLRTLKFCKYLVPLGWTPAVIGGGANDPDFAPDETLLAEVPSQASVTRIDYPHRSPWRRARAWLFGHRLGRLGTWAGHFMDFPCRFRGWARLAEREARALVAQMRPDVLFTSAPPFSMHCVGLALKRRFHIPWVADFRDPWASNPSLVESAPAWHLARHRWAERLVAREADVCVFAHPVEAERFMEVHGLGPDRALAISNGYDPEDFRGLPPRKPATGPRVRFVHTGSFYRHYSPAPLRRALEHAAAARPELLRQMEVVFVGGCPVDFSGLPGLEARVLPRVSHAEAVAWLGRADALMNVYESKTGRHGVSGKLFEYLAAGRPILAVLPPDGTAAEIVRAARAGFTADPDRPDDVLDAVERCIAAAREPDFRPDPGVVRGYARPELAAALARVLDRVAG